MGQQVNATCLDCGQTFTVDDGGGFIFHLLRCNKCERKTPLDLINLANSTFVISRV